MVERKLGARVGLTAVTAIISAPVSYVVQKAIAVWGVLDDFGEWLGGALRANVTPAQAGWTLTALVFAVIWGLALWLIWRHLPPEVVISPPKTVNNPKHSRPARVETPNPDPVAETTQRLNRSAHLRLRIPAMETLITSAKESFDVWLAASDQKVFGAGPGSSRRHYDRMHSIAGEKIGSLARCFNHEFGEPFVEVRVPEPHELLTVRIRNADNIYDQSGEVVDQEAKLRHKVLHETNRLTIEACEAALTKRKQELATLDHQTKEASGLSQPRR